MIWISFCAPKPAIGGGARSGTTDINVVLLQKITVAAEGVAVPFVIRAGADRILRERDEGNNVVPLTVNVVHQRRGDKGAGGHACIASSQGG
jgi:hypothetical protein